MYKLQSDHRKRKINILHNGCMRDVTITNNIIKYFRKSISQKSLAKHQKELQIPLVPVKISTLSYKALSVFKEKKEKKEEALVQEKSLTRDFTPYCFSTFSRSCLKHASMRSWKGLSASVTFSPWIRTPSARCGIWWKKNSSVRQLHQTHPGLQRWEISYMLLLPSEECISVCH